VSALLVLVDDAAGDDGGDWAAFEVAGIEWGVAGFAGGLLHVVGPFVRGGENREVRGLAGGDFAFDTNDARGTAGKEFDHAHEGEVAGMNELLERESYGGLEAENAEGGAVELDVFEGGFVRSMVGGDGVDGAVGETGDEGFPIFARG